MDVFVCLDMCALKSYLKFLFFSSIKVFIRLFQVELLLTLLTAVNNFLIQTNFCKLWSLANIFKHPKYKNLLLFKNNSLESQQHNSYRKQFYK